MHFFVQKPTNIKVLLLQKISMKCLLLICRIKHLADINFYFIYFAKFIADKIRSKNKQRITKSGNTCGVVNLRTAL